jgi:hypothetical protein
LLESVPRARRLRAKIAPPSTGRFFADAMGDAGDYAHGVTRRLSAAARAKLPGAGKSSDR